MVNKWKVNGILDFDELMKQNKMCVWRKMYKSEEQKEKISLKSFFFLKR